MRGLTYVLTGSVLVATMIACGGGEVTTPPPNAPVATATPAGTGSAPTTAPTTATTAAVPPVAIPPAAPAPVVIRASTMAKDLEAIGLDPKKLPSLSKMDPVKRNKVMNTFTKSLGVKCTSCHLENFKADTPKKKIARKMWDRWVVGLAFEDGNFLYCDSCHQGHEEFLERADKKALSVWMEEQLVKKLKRTDKKDHGCETCHGETFSGDFLAAWKK